MYEDVAKSYQQTNFFTADPLRLVLMCYDRAISSLKQARESYAANDYAAKGLAVKKTLDILYELSASLDMKKGGEIAVNLRSLYTYMTQALIEADLKKDLTVFGAIIRMLEELEVEWKGLSRGRAQEVRQQVERVPEMARQQLAACRAWSA
jgi:flagellar secretion chaperone FliS